jgi:hypothetical protein
MIHKNALNDGPLAYAVKEYWRLFEEARLGQQPWDEEATLRALVEEMRVTVAELRAAIAHTPQG